MTRPLIALLTDFGIQDPYVGVMKGVMKGICPAADFVDLTHQVRPQAVADAAFLLATSAPHFPPGTVFLSVVDPGVGSDRAALAAQLGDHLFVAPDNGLLSLVWRHVRDPITRLIVNPDYRLPMVSATFHGRDIFAPAAAHLAAGVPIEDLGPPVPDIEQLAFAHPMPDGPGALSGSVLHVDHFGNVITNIRASDLPRDADPETMRMGAGASEITGIHRTYSEVRSGDLLMHWGSSGYLEVAVRDGSAADQLKIGVGAPVRLTWPNAGGA